MKRLISFCFMVLCAMTLCAQKDVTTFLGIPVDGTYSAMRQKLIAKGFKPQRLGRDEYFSGRFNGEDVQLFIVSNNNKVWRIALFEVVPRTEAQIKIHFNSLVSQFESNKRYVSLADQTLSDSENLWYGMNIQHINYQAIFYQYTPKVEMDSTIIQKWQENFVSQYSNDQLRNPQNTVQIHSSTAYYDNMIEQNLQKFQEIATKKPVWIQIQESQFGGYMLGLYYDNGYNMANGEDL